MSSMIANKTVPPVSVRVDLIGDAVSVARIEVPRSRSVVSTKNGKILRRMMKADGTPESAPMYPYEIVTRLSDLGQLDYSDQPVFGSTLSDFDPQELKRLRRIIDTYQSSDRNLLELSDEDLEKSLRLTKTIDGKSVPTLTGLLLLGRKSHCASSFRRMKRPFKCLKALTLK